MVVNTEIQTIHASSQVVLQTANTAYATATLQLYRILRCIVLENRRGFTNAGWLTRSRLRLGYRCTGYSSTIIRIDNVHCVVLLQCASNLRTQVLMQRRVCVRTRFTCTYLYTCVNVFSVLSRPHVSDATTSIRLYTRSSLYRTSFFSSLSHLLRVHSKKKTQ